MTPEQRIEALELEFDRLVERQGVLHNLLDGGDLDRWLSTKRIGTRDYTLVIDTAVGEARQGALAMATIVKTLAALAPAEPERVAMDPLKKIQDDLEAKRAERAAAGA